MKPISFENKVRKNPRPIVVEFWAPWCGPCKMMAPYLKQAETAFNGQVDLWKVNADENPEVLKSLGIRGIPTMIGYNRGEEVARKTGAMTPDNVHAFFSAVQENKPFRRTLSWPERIIRILPALLFFYAGVTRGPSYWLIAVGVVFLFSAVYDRCPAYKMISTQIKSWFKRTA